jgi:hypothetical protein
MRIAAAVGVSAAVGLPPALLALTWGLSVASDQKEVSLGIASILSAGGLLHLGFLYVENARERGGDDAALLVWMGKFQR